MLRIVTSTYADGSMKPLHPDDVEGCTQRREKFLSSHSIAAADTTNVRLEYAGDNYCRYRTVNNSYKGDGIIRPSSIIADGLVVTKPGHALLLPLADCIGAVIHDPVNGVLMLSHLGRHNLEQFGGTHSIEYLVNKHGCNPTDLTVWLSPAAGKDHYPLYNFGNRSLHEVAIEQLTQADMRPEHITTSPIDSAVDLRYYSHSQFLKGLRETDGRIAVVAMMN